MDDGMTRTTTTDHDLLIEAVTTLKAQSITLSDIKSDLKENMKTVNDRCAAQELRIFSNESDIKDLNTRWKVMVGVVCFVIVTLLTVAGIVVAYLG